jgi:hypothetical protein
MNNSIAHPVQISRRGLVAGALSAGALPAAALSAVAAQAEGSPCEGANADKAAQPASWVSALALQAATYAAPIVAMYNLRDLTSVGPHAKVPPNEIWRIENIASPEVAAQAGYVTPNVNVIYGFGFMDLGQQPPAPAVVAYSYNTPKINPKVASSQMQFLDPLQFWDIFAAAMNENPPPRNEIEAVLPQFK